MSSIGVRILTVIRNARQNTFTEVNRSIGLRFFVLISKNAPKLTRRNGRDRVHCTESTNQQRQSLVGDHEIIKRSGEKPDCLLGSAEKAPDPNATLSEFGPWNLEINQSSLESLGTVSLSLQNPRSAVRHASRLADCHLFG